MMVNRSGKGSIVVYLFLKHTRCRDIRKNVIQLVTTVYIHGQVPLISSFDMFGMYWDWENALNAVQV